MKKIILLCTACLLTIACLAQEPTGIFASDTLSTPSSNIKRSIRKNQQNAIYTITFWEVRALAQTSVFWWEVVR